MTRQEEIREGMDKLIYDRIMSFLTEDEWKDVAPEHHPKSLLCEKLTGELLSYLHSQRCRIEVDKELPEWFKFKWCGLQPEEVFTDDVEEAGYTAFEPLIGG